MHKQGRRRKEIPHTSSDHLVFLDRLKKLVIIAMFADDELMHHLVLKGGNLLDVVFGISSRGSIDLDFSIEGTLDSIEELRDRISGVLDATLSEEGFRVFDVTVRDVPPELSTDMRDFWGGYRIEFKVIENHLFARLGSRPEQMRKQARTVGMRGSTKFKIDISRHEYCRGKQERLLDGYTIFTYSPAMVVAEKLRAVCQQMPEYTPIAKNHPRARARDFLDIYALVEAFGIDFDDISFRDLVRNMFAIKRVPVGLIGRISETREYHRPDFVAVIDTVKPGANLEEFDFYFDYVLAKCRPLESLGDE